MANLKALRARIASVKSTRKITQAMKMVAAAKLRRAQQQAEAARPYAERMERMLASLGAATLPRWARRMYGLPGLGLTEPAATAAVKAFRQAALAVPARVRESPIVRAARARVEAEPLTAC